jgi:hypothetical protein
MTELGRTEHFKSLKEDGGFFYYVMGAQNANPGCPYMLSFFYLGLAESSFSFNVVIMEILQ